jgi:hypothetical protein
MANMTDPELNQISTDPRVFREHLIVRTSRGALPFSEIEQPFQRQFLADMDAGLIAVRDDTLPRLPRLWGEMTKGAGKDLMVSIGILWLLAFATRPVLIQAGASDRSQCDELRKSAIGILRENSWLSAFVEVQNWLLLNRDTDSRCEILAADETGSHGARPDCVILNELTHHSDDGFASTVFDNAAKCPHNFSIVITNHGRERTWQHAWRELARTSPRWGFHSYTQPAPWINSDELAEQRRRTSEARYRRLWLGEWVGESDSALSDAAIEAAILLGGPRESRQSANEQCFGGLDVGVSQDRTGLAIVTRAPEERVKLARCQSWTPPRSGKVNLMDVETAVLDAHDRFRFDCVLYDPSQCELLAQRLRTKNVPMIAVPFTAGSLQEMASATLEAFNSGTVELFDHRQLVADLRALRFIERGNSYRLDAARTSAGHADLATAFVLALLAAKRNPLAWFNPFVPDAHPMESLDDLLRRRDEMNAMDIQPAHPSALQRIEQAMPRPADRQTAKLTPMAAALAENGLLSPENW